MTSTWVANGAPSTASFSPLTRHVPPSWTAVVVDVREIEAARRLEMREGEPNLAGDDAADQFAGAGGTAASQQAAADHHGVEVGLDDQCLADLLHDDHGLDRAAAQAAHGFVERRAQDAQVVGEAAPERRAASLPASGPRPGAAGTS